MQVLAFLLDLMASAMGWGLNPVDPMGGFDAQVLYYCSFMAFSRVEHK